ncbi:flagellar hook-associated protein FlgK [Salipiger sp. P9]|uniref:flagellar hook-associated protein FlgK n=1 Tax=Salipiger pentaromativorans TaxID=2943193 RepID=UPI0021578DCF|nr:flagellar hook-associated protein FlgK [Salipiger pentaromativorans]MCR8549522.1 flagellar hook-associated protein FlgK [Salipiger pentaromativorans]
MSLSGALSNALSGLTANSRAAALVASNIANATTESYGRRSLDLSSRPAGTSGGVSIDRVSRNVDLAVLSDRRLSDAQAGFAGDMQTFASRIEDLLGTSDAAGSLTGRFSAFENALLSAASDPSSTQRLQSVALAAEDFTGTLNRISDEIQLARGDADRAIAGQVATLNTALGRVKALNAAIADRTLRDGDPSPLLDERQRVIDGISAIVPLRTVARDDGALALYAASGTVLLDPTIHSEPVEIGFTAQDPVTAWMTLDNALLSGLTLGGVPVNSSNEGPLGGGTLGAQFQIRDTVAPDMQAALDGIARDLIERFAPGGPDSTLAATDSGLFTDGGAAFDALDETGLAGRISLNPLVDPGGTGTWRLRDGLGAASQGDVGDARLLQAYSDALESLEVPGSTSLGTGASSFGQHVADFYSAISAARLRADGEQSFGAAQNTALRELELSKGVDTDAELQDLMRIEQQYAANARVISTVDELMQTLLTI